MLGDGPQSARGPQVARRGFVFPSLAGHGVAAVALGTPGSSALQFLQPPYRDRSISWKLPQTEPA